MTSDERPRISVGLNAVVIAVTDETPRILTVNAADAPDVPATRGGTRIEALPFGPLDPGRYRTLELELRTVVGAQTGLALGYVEQLYTFGDRDRVPRTAEGRSRVMSVGYLALVREGHVEGEGQARWRDWYGFFPWEDWREGRPDLIESAIEPALTRWVRDERSAAARRARRERTAITFGLDGAPWDGERVLERYELLYEAGLVTEAPRDRGAGGAAGARGDGRSTVKARALSGLGWPMAYDHRRILATALSRLRGKLKYRPVVFELLPTTFTLFQLQRLVEALAGVRLHKQNFRRLVERGGLVEGTGQLESHTGGRPAELFRFRREVLRERRATGIGLPVTRPGGPR